jgi:methanogenic corrinoid protein MtbC1
MDMNRDQCEETVEPVRRGLARQRSARERDPDRSETPSALDRFVKTDLVPRVALAHGAGSKRRVKQGDDAKLAFSTDDVIKFADLIVMPDETKAHRFIERALDAGHSLDDVYLELLQPVARYLGDLWVADTCDFATVTLALCSMHRMVRELNPAFQQTRGHGQVGHHHALLTPSGHENHSFGLTIVAEFLRRAGWMVTSGPLSSKRELAQLVRSERFTVVGFSLSRDAGLNTLAAEIQTVRKASANRGTWVIVGGRVFVERPQLVARVGADFTASDARQATILAQNLAMTAMQCRA